jgi:hypothetical protein
VPGAWLNQAILQGHKVHIRTTFVPVLFVSDQAEPRSQAARDREAREYWESLTPEQEGWVARKMGFHEFGGQRSLRRPRN